MAYKNDNLQFYERSMLSTTYSKTGREFGLFVDLSLSFNRFNINPSFGITSLVMEEVHLELIHVMLIMVDLNILAELISILSVIFLREIIFKFVI